MRKAALIAAATILLLIRFMPQSRFAYRCAPASSSIGLTEAEYRDFLSRADDHNRGPNCFSAVVSQGRYQHPD